MANVAGMADEQLFRSKHDYLVGVYYFAGWWQKSPNKWETGGRDWRLDYPERIPLLGEYNDQATMDREITAAASHGVDFFQILWYPNGGPLNEGLRTFLASTNAGRMKFTIEFVNHPPFDLSKDADWEAACWEWCLAMKHPSYLWLDGRPVFKVHGMDYFYKQNGDDPKKVINRLDIFRNIAKENGLASPLISTGVIKVTSKPYLAYKVLAAGRWIDRPGQGASASRPRSATSSQRMA